MLHLLFILFFCSCCFYNSSSWCRNPLFGFMTFLLCFTLLNAFCRLYFFIFIKYPITIVELRLTPATQCIKTFPKFLCLVMKSKHFEKCMEIFSNGLSSISILSWAISLIGSFVDFSDRIDIAAVILYFLRMAWFCDAE